MSTNKLLLIVAILAFLLIAARIAGWTFAFIGAYIITLNGFNTSLFTYALPLSGFHYGIAPSMPTVQLADIILASAVIAVIARREHLKIGWILASFTLPAFVMLLAIWGNTPEQWSGIKLYSVAIISFGLGRWLGANLTTKAELILALACLGTLLLQLIFAFAQARGLIIIDRASESAEKWIGVSRAVGLYSHPGSLGRNFFFLCCFLLPLSISNQRRTRWLAYLALAFGSVATLLTVSRSNSLAVIATLVLWVIFIPRPIPVARRIGLIVIAGSLLAISTDAISKLQSREDEDPTHGHREILLNTGLSQIRSAPLTGTGPNYYVEVVGLRDPWAAAGFPLHNSLLYPIAELGIPLAMAFFAPILIAAAGAAMRTARRRALDAHTLTLLVITPGFLLITLAGWGSVQAESLPLWFMAFGFLASRNNLPKVGHPVIRSPQMMNWGEPGRSDSLGFASPTTAPF